MPIEYAGNKLFVEVEMGGKPRRFLFDTGSPSMMSKALARELGLEAVDHRLSRDSHGAVVRTDIVQAEIGVGAMRLHKVPVFVAEFPKTAQCLFDGVLGSEVLPLCAWQIDLPQSMLRCSSKVSALDHVDGASSLRLHDAGYPHAPIIDIELADDAHSKALFDTGSPELMAISPPDLQGAARNRGVVRTRSGFGSLGGSIGGLAPSQKHTRVQLHRLKIGDIALPNAEAVVREGPPSLIGASILEHFVVTLDASNSQAYFDQYQAGDYSRNSYGLALSFEGHPRVSLVWEDSPAQQAGIQVGDRVTSINGQAMDDSCGAIRDASRMMSSGDSLDIAWQGGHATLRRPHRSPERGRKTGP